MVSYGEIDIPQVLIDNGLGLNVCTITSLRSLGHTEIDLRRNSMIASGLTRLKTKH